MDKRSIGKQIKIRVDEWATKIETTAEGTFIYIEEEDKEGVLVELTQQLSEIPKIHYVIIDGEMVWEDGCDE
ncbi:hypothetical protein VPBG_00194 [Vibrio phage helene 12B3]|uniref:hypothetical protein n=1 Tax=Vibrio phage helene 12B3 TaxID=573173 RepID=UPI0002C05811|nr:hypothetical protein VPBG_00194 [Vibrio phage helene 12B3]AGG57966.1 hypothetical protein VPBG_00194 [Vibrio phage helene 12B3]